MPSLEHSRRAKPIALGDEPPLSVGDNDPSRYSRRGVSVRWLFGVVVTAVTSLALMGGAMFAALEGRYVMSAEAALQEGTRDAPHSRKAAKGDRVRREYEEVSSRRILEVPTVVRQGERDLITKRPYALVRASLVLDNDDIGMVPRFNEREIATEDESEAVEAVATDAIYDRAVDGEITVSVSAFPLDGAMAFDDSIVVGEDEVIRELMDGPEVEESTILAADLDGFIPSAAIVPHNVSIVQENMSQLVKRSADDDEVSDPSNLVELVQPGDTLSKILLGSGANQDDIDAIDAILSPLGVAELQPGQILSIAFRLEETGEEAQRRPERVTIYAKNAHVATVAMRDDGSFVLREAPPGPAPVLEDEVAATADRLPTIYRSLYQTAVDHDLPQSVRDTLLRIFSVDVDFNAQVRPGDAFTILHSVGVEEDAPSEILYASLRAGGVERTFYRFKSEDGRVDYFDDEGRTGDKLLLRKPMERGVFRSGFGMRRHPILRRRRMHKGVDWAAPRGTKIYAAGDGVVKQAGWKAGYGRWVSIRHKNGYVTGYAHQSRIASGIKPGVAVKQGQVIGYVGSTGFSTGPHLHYEVHVNGRPVNPLKIRLRRGRELSGEPLVRFQRERERIEALFEREEVPPMRG